VDPTGKFAYVANGNSANISAYTINPSTGALTAIAGSPFPAGSTPSSVVVDPTGKFAYVANFSSANVSAYTINPSTGALTDIVGSPFPTFDTPISLVVDPTGKFAYVANRGSNNVSGYTINPSTGALTPIAGSPFSAGSEPFSVVVDPTGNFAYVANSFSGNVSGYAINPSTGALSAISGSPFAAGSFPLSVAVRPATPSLSINKIHVGTFMQGGTAEWDITVTNLGSAATTGTTTVSDTLPTGYTVSSFSGTAVSWSCTGNNTQTASCTSTSSVSGGSSFPAVKMFVNVPANSPISVMNTAKAYGGGDPAHTNLASAATGSDTVSVAQAPASIMATAGTPQAAWISMPFSVNLQATVKDAGNVGVPNVNVTFQAPVSGPSGTFALPCSGTMCVVQTTASGVATAPTFTANGTLGSYNVTASAGSLTPANFALTNVALPTFTKAIANPLGAGIINEGDTVPITFTIANQNSIGLTGLAFTDTLPVGLTVQSPNGLSNTCGGMVMATPGSGTIRLTGGMVAATASCTVTIQAMAVVQGAQTNPSVMLTSNESAPAASAAVDLFIYPWWLVFFQ
jgi:uncharacterized repeat protein (TIGR01451 family)